MCLIFSFCRDADPGRDMHIYFADEINNRREVLDNREKGKDTLKINTSAIDEEINSYILLSKDRENLSASVHKANAYFLNMANSYGINYNDFTKLNTQMNLDEIALVLKQNELNLFNQLIFKTNLVQATPYTAQ